MGTSSQHTAPVGRGEQIRALDVLLGEVVREADEDAPRVGVCSSEVTPASARRLWSRSLPSGAGRWA